MSKIILITGASRGFGELMTKTLAEKGNVVYATMRDVSGKNKDRAEALQSWAKENNSAVHTLELDVTNQDTIDKAVDEIISKEGKIDVLINNAGIGNFGVTEGFSIEQLQNLFDVNVFGCMRTIRTVLPHMRKEKSGQIIQFSSMLGRTVVPFIGPYSATKFAMEAMCESLADEVKELGIDVSLVQPGGYPTDFGKNMLMPEKDLTSEYGEFAKKAMESMNGFMESMKGDDAPKPQDVADAVLALVEAEPGKRERRVAVGGEVEGARMINDVSAKVQVEMLKGFGLA